MRNLLLLLIPAREHLVHAAAACGFDNPGSLATHRPLANAPLPHVPRLSAP